MVRKLLMKCVNEAHAILRKLKKTEFQIRGNKTA